MNRDLMRRLREAQKLTQDDLGALMGLSVKSGRVLIAYWEGGQRTPSDAQVSKLAACLGYWPIHGDLALRRECVEAGLRAGTEGSL